MRTTLERIKGATIRHGVLTGALILAGACDKPRVASCFRPEIETVTLAGQLERKTFPGRPNFESLESGDEAETGLYLILPKPICSVGDSTSDARSDVTLVQLILDDEGYSALRPHLSTMVRLRGKLIVSHTGHHHAPLLLDVTKPVEID